MCTDAEGETVSGAFNVVGVDGNVRKGTVIA
jgi:hypothetical protein